MKTYTEDQMKDAFEQSRLTHPMVGFKYDTFEDFIKTIPVSLSEREQPVKDVLPTITEGEPNSVDFKKQFASYKAVMAKSNGEDLYKAWLEEKINYCRKEKARTKNKHIGTYEAMCERLFALENALSEYSRLSPCKEKWISVEERLPKIIEGTTSSENVWAICKDKRRVMSYGYFDEGGKRYYCWGDCYGDTEGDGEWDTDDKVTHWMPFPSPPTGDNTKKGKEK